MSAHRITYLVRFRRPMIVLKNIKDPDPPLWHENLTKSSNSSASALNLLTNPESPSDPFLPNATRGLNFDPNAFSRNTIRG